MSLEQDWYQKLQDRLRTHGISVDEAELCDLPPPDRGAGRRVTRGEYALCWGTRTMVPNKREYFVGIHDEDGETAHVSYRANAPKFGGGVNPNFWYARSVERTLPPSLRKLRKFGDNCDTTDEAEALAWVDLLVTTFLKT